MTDRRALPIGNTRLVRLGGSSIPVAALTFVLTSSFFLSACNLPLSSSSSQAPNNQSRPSPSPDNVTNLQDVTSITLVDGIPVDINEPKDTVSAPSGSVDLPTDSLFATGQYVLLPAGISQLKKVAVLLNGVVSNANLQFIGHTDCPGGPSINNPLSLKRAETVLTWFKNNGLAAGTMVASGVGSTPLVCPTSGGVSSPQDRRVEIKISY